MAVSRRTRDVLLALALGAGCGVLFARATCSARHPATALPTGAIAAPSLSADDPVAFVPATSRGVLHADLRSLRSAPGLARLFDRGARDEPCEASLLRRVRRIAVTFPGEDLGEFGVAFTGDLSRDELLACARGSRGGGGRIANDRYRGLDVAHVGVAPTPGLMPTSRAAEIIYVPGGTVLAGAPEVVRRMADRGMAGQASAAERDNPTEWLLAQLDDSVPVRFAFRLGPASHAVEGAEAFQHVVGIAASATFGEGAELTLVLACDDFDAPRAVAEALESMRLSLAAQLGTPGLGHALRGARIERRGGDVRVRATLDGADLVALLGSLEQALRPPAPSVAPRDQ